MMSSWLPSLPLWVWFFGIGVALLALELTTLTFDLLWLSLGALCGALLAWLAPNLPSWAPMLLSVVVGVAALGAGRRWARRQRGANRFVNPPDALVGRAADVTRGILPPALGLVRVGNDTWSATSATPIAAGQRVIIRGRSATVLQVELQPLL